MAMRRAAHVGPEKSAKLGWLREIVQEAGVNGQKNEAGAQMSLAWQQPPIATGGGMNLVALHIREIDRPRPGPPVST